MLTLKTPPQSWCLSAWLGSRHATAWRCNSGVTFGVSGLVLLTKCALTVRDADMQLFLIKGRIEGGSTQHKTKRANKEIRKQQW